VQPLLERVQESLPLLDGNGNAFFAKAVEQIEKHRIKGYGVRGVPSTGTCLAPFLRLLKSPLELIRVLSIACFARAKMLDFASDAGTNYFRSPCGERTRRWLLG
jgi:hypothetical protein